MGARGGRSNPVVMISGHGDIDTAVQTMRLGAFDYISKPPDLNRLLVTLRNALDKSNLVVETKKLKKKISKQSNMVYLFLIACWMTLELSNMSGRRGISEET